MTKKILFVTTPIFYINAKPHLGHLYSQILCDYQKRLFTKQSQKNLEKSYQKVYMITGTDEHGQKVFQKANMLKTDPQVHCDTNSKYFKDLADTFNIDYDYFVRTTSDHHKNFVKNFWILGTAKNLFYEELYKGWYSIRDETFVPEKDLVKNSIGKYLTKEGEEVEHISESNYLFKLTDYKNEIEEFLRKDGSILPKEKTKIVMSKNSLEDQQDVSVSRNSDRVSWGVQVPGNSSQTIYVWFDALLNYLSSAKKLLYDEKISDQEFCMEKTGNIDFQHIVGKDIIKFHTIMWKGLLTSVSIKSGVSVLVHAHWQHSNKKMSKSIGNIIDPFEQVANLALKNSQNSEENIIEALKLYIQVNGPLINDVSFSVEGFVTFYNNFVDEFVNVYHRIVGKKILKDFVGNSKDWIVEPIDRIFQQNIEKLLNDFDRNSNEQWVVSKRWEILSQVFSTINKYISDTEPWFCNNPHRRSCIIYLVLETQRAINPQLALFLPKFAQEFDHCFNLNSKIRHNESIKAIDELILDETQTDMKILEFDRQNLLKLQRKKFVFQKS